MPPYDNTATQAAQPMTKVEQAFMGLDRSKKSLEEDVTKLLDIIGALGNRLGDVLEPDLPAATGTDQAKPGDAQPPASGVNLADRISESERHIDGQRRRINDAHARLKDILSRVQL